jgi:uncharacterized small protein (DUF1192 family)
MTDEIAEPRRLRGALLTDLEREDLELYAREELEERIERLRGEIARAERQLERKGKGISAAEALFNFNRD